MPLLFEQEEAMKKISSHLLCWILACCLLALPASGQAAARNKKTISLITGPETSDLLEFLGKPLQQAAGIQPGHIHFHVIRDPTWNAMALPGQNILLHSGLILAVRGPDELASVMAHEMAHLSAGHHVQLASTLQDIALRSMVAFVAGLAAGALTGDGQLTQAAILGGSAASRTTLLEVIRSKETQADRLAIHYLTKAGFDPQGMVRFMKRLHRRQQLSNAPPPYLLTHPLSSQRLTEAQQLIASQPTNPSPHIRKEPPPHASLPENSQGHALLDRAQAVLEAQTSDDLNGVITRFRQRLETEPDHFSARYGLAIAERYMGQLHAAHTNLERLLKPYPHDPHLLRERGLVRLEMGQPAKAEEDFRAALKYQPKKTNTDIRYRLAFSLHEQEKLADASRILRQLTLEHPFVASYFYLLGVVEGKQQHMGASHLALARHFHLIREERMARWHYQEAIRQFSDGTPGNTIARDALNSLKKSPNR